MPPDFNQKTIDTLAKRAAFICSNPDCQVATAGPNSESNKATIIGEAAHIYGARLDSARYDDKTSDLARSEITNAIWLCRNCHKKVDRDSKKYSSELLFAWREEHERIQTSKLGSRDGSIRQSLQDSQLEQFQKYPPIIRRIVIDKPTAWEWRLTAELMRYLNRPVFRKLEDLRGNFYTRPPEHLKDEDVVEWVQSKLDEMVIMVRPITNLFNRLTESWGAYGEQGDVDEIHHTCCLIRDSLEQIIIYEEQIYFVNVSGRFKRLIELLKDCLGLQVDKLRGVPDFLDEMVFTLSKDYEGTPENPKTVYKTIEFELPDGWEKEMERELQRGVENSFEPEQTKNGFNYGIIGWGVLILILLMIFA